MRRLIFTLLPLFAALSAHAEEIKAPKIVAGPYIQACSDSEFTVVWQTDSDALCWVEIAPDDGTHFYNTARKQYFQTIHGRRPIGRWHKVTVDGLEPNTLYRYRVLHKGITTNQGNKRVRYTESKGSDVYRRQPYTIRTLGGGEDVTRFAIGNDFHDKPELISQLFSKDIITPQRYDFVLYNGDMVSSFESEERLVSSVIAPSVAQFATQIPLFFSRGNHETRGAAATTYTDYFPTTTAEPYYTFSDGPALFIVLDGGEDKPDSDIEYHDLVRYDNYREREAKWLKSVVESEQFKAAAVKIVIIHIPPKSSGWHGEAEIARLFVPILNQAGIDAMFCGHIHKYRFSEANDPTYGCNFPIVCLPNRVRADIEVSKERVSYSITNANGEITNNEILIRR
ncbi:MAG: metallophosphoesterase [Alistipes sp.]|nr:metallophosphoesterase [Alistipes sp.]